MFHNTINKSQSPLIQIPAQTKSNSNSTTHSKKRKNQENEAQNKDRKISSEIPNDVLLTIFQFLPRLDSPQGNSLVLTNKSWHHSVLSYNLYRAIIHGIDTQESIPNNGLWKPLSLSKLEFVKYFLKERNQDLTAFIDKNSGMIQQVKEQLFYETRTLFPVNTKELKSESLVNEINTIWAMCINLIEHCIDSQTILKEDILYDNLSRFEKLISASSFNGSNIFSVLSNYNNKSSRRDHANNKNDALLELILNHNKIKFKSFFNEKWANDQHLVFTALNIPFKDSTKPGPFKYIDRSFHINAKYALAAIKQSQSALAHLQYHNVKNDKDFTLLAFHYSPKSYMYFGEKIKDKRKLALAAVTYSGLYLQYVSPRLKNNFEIVNKAIENCPFAINHVGKKIIENGKLFTQLVLKAYYSENFNINYLSHTIRDKVMAIIEKNLKKLK